MAKSGYKRPSSKQSLLRKSSKDAFLAAWQWLCRSLKKVELRRNG